MADGTRSRLGIEALTLLGMPVVEHIRLAAELGCIGISTGLIGLPMAMFGEDDLYPAWSLEADPALRREAKAAIRDTGVEILLGEGFTVRPDRDVRDAAAGLDIMAELGTRRINTVGMDPDPGRSYDQLATLAEMAVDRGMAFTIEFAPPNAINSLASALAAAAHIGAERARILIDAMHFFRSGATLDALRALDPGRIGYVQLCDVPMASRGDDYMQEAMFGRVVPGEGELPLREFVAALPADVEIGLEVPQLATLRAGTSPRDHAARVVAGARAVGA